MPPARGWLMAQGLRKTCSLLRQQLEARQGALRCLKAPELLSRWVVIIYSLKISNSVINVFADKWNTCIGYKISYTELIPCSHVFEVQNQDTEAGNLVHVGVLLHQEQEQDVSVGLFQPCMGWASVQGVHLSPSHAENDQEDQTSILILEVLDDLVKWFSYM